MRRKVSIMVARVDGMDLDGLAEALGGRVRRLNAGTFLDIEVEDDPTSRARERTRGAGRRRASLPEGSPLVGMGEDEAMLWARRHTTDELGRALGVSRPTAYRRLRSGHVLP